MTYSSLFRKPWLWGICFVFVGTFVFYQLQTNAFSHSESQDMSSAAPSQAQANIDEIIVEKTRHVMSLYSRGQLFKTYNVAFGANPVGHKVQEGDERTPEGTYTITSHNSKSAFYKSLRVSYPNAQDKANAKELGVDPGGDIMIHGLPNGYGWLGSWHLFMDWTDGCIAVTNQEIDEIYNLVRDGIKITIVP